MLITLIVIRLIIYFKVNDNRPLKQYTEVWQRVRILINREFDGEPVDGYQDKYIKVKSYGD